MAIRVRRVRVALPEMAGNAGLDAGRVDGRL